MSAQYPITAVILDGTTPTDGTEPRIPYAQMLAIPAGTDVDVVVSLIGQDTSSYSTTGTLSLAVAGAVMTTAAISGAASATMSITASQTSIDAKVYPWSMAFSRLVTTGTTAKYSVVPESIFAILPNENE